MLPDLTKAAWRSVLPFVIGACPSALMAVEQNGSSLLWGAYVSLTSTVKQLAGTACEYQRADEEDEELIWDDGDDDDDDSPECSAASTNSRQSYVTEEAPDLGPSCSPQVLAPGNYCPKCSEQSSILRQTDLMALAAAVPLRHKWRDWQLLYSSSRYAAIYIMPCSITSVLIFCLRLQCFAGSVCIDAETQLRMSWLQGRYQLENLV